MSYTKLEDSMTFLDYKSTKIIHQKQTISFSSFRKMFIEEFITSE